MTDLDYQRTGRKCIEETASIIAEYPSRLSGSEECNRCADELFEKLKDFCDTTSVQSFDLHPGSFWGFLKIIPVFYFSGFAAFFLPALWRVIPVFGLIFGMAMMICQYSFIGEFFDFLFKRKKARNVVGTIDPQGEVHRNIIISGHHDSAPVTRMDSEKVQPYVIILFYFAFIFSLFIIIFFTISLISGIERLPFWSFAVLLAGVPFILAQFFGINSRKGSPGAGDNMISTLVSLELGRALAEMKKKDPTLFANTRIYIISFDGEEAGLRGSRNFFGENMNLFTDIPTYHLNLDCLYSLKDLQVLQSDLNNRIKLDGELVEDLINISRKLGLPLKPYKMVFGSGATDAAESARRGIKSTTIIGIPTTVMRKGIVYHTVKDTVSSIEPEIVYAVLRIIWTYLASGET